MANTREVMGEQACFDALIADSLTHFEDDEVTRVADSCLSRHNNLTSLVLSNCSNIEVNGVSDCNSLETVDILGGGSIDANAFSNDPNMQHLILRSLTRTSLSNINAFYITKIQKREGAIYVPANLVSTYKSNSRWKEFVIYPITFYPASVFETIVDSWSDIITASSDGTYATKYEIGDTKSMVIDGTTYYFQLVAKDADVLASDGTTTVPMTWILFRRCYAENHRMNPGNSSGAQGTGANGGWEYSEMRSWLNDTILPLFPSEVRAAIKEVRKYSDYVIPGESTVTHDQVTADKLWIPSGREIFGGSTYEQTGANYTSYFNTSDRRIRYAFATGNAAYWWLRTAWTASNFGRVSNNGTSFASLESYSATPVVLGFCI